MSLKKSRNTKPTTPSKRNCFKFLQMKNKSNASRTLIIFNETDRARKVTTNVTFKRNRPSPVIARVSRAFFASGYGYINISNFLPNIQQYNNTLYYIIIIIYILFNYFNVTNVTMMLTPLKMGLSGLRYLL